MVGRLRSSESAPAPQRAPNGSRAREAWEWEQHFEGAHARPARLAFASKTLRKDFIRAMQRLVPKEGSVLDVGCGEGELLAALSNPSRSGIDMVAAAADVARRRVPEATITVENALTFRHDRTYDSIVCDRLCHFVTDVQGLLTNLRRHLSEHGRIYLTCFNALLEPAFGLAEALGAREKTPPANWLSETDLDNLFKLSGLEVVRFEGRLIMPMPGAGFLNRYLAPLPVIQRLAIYRIYVLRRAPTPRTEQSPSVSVVVPTRNESGNIDAILRRTPKMGSRTELIFVEGGSTDDTWARVQKAVSEYKGPLEVSCCQQPGKGKGDAVREGFSRATGDLLMILDADMTVEPEELPKFYEAALSRVGDYIHGTRLVYPMEDEAMRFLNRLGNIGFSRLFTFLLNQPIKDTLCGTKVIWADDYRRLAAQRHIFGDFDPFGDFDLIFGAVNLNLKLAEIPIRYRSRTYGETNISRFRHGLLLLRMSLVAARKLKFV